MSPFVQGLATNQPLPPTALTVTPEASGNQLAWSPPAAELNAEVDSYRVYRSDEAGGRSLLGSVDATQTTYLDAAITPGDAYVYYVTAVSAAGESEPSNFASNYPLCWDLVVVFPLPPQFHLDCLIPPAVGIVRVLLGP